MTDEKALAQMKIFGKNLSKIRQQKNISRKEIAAKVGVKEISYGKYERAETSPTLDKIVEMSKILDCSVGDLIGDNPNAKDKQIFEYRLQRALNLANVAGIEVEPYSNGLAVSIPSTTEMINDDGTSEIISVISAYRIKDKISFVTIIELSESQAIKQNKPFIEVFENNIKPTKKATA